MKSGFEKGATNAEGRVKKKLTFEAKSHAGPPAYRFTVVKRAPRNQRRELGNKMGATPNRARFAQRKGGY